MIVLGIDPGSNCTGFGLIQIVDKTAKYVASGCIRIAPKTLDLRLKQIYAGITDVIAQYQPDQSAIEQVFMHKNAASAIKLGQARGVAMVCLANHDLPVSEYSARQVKQAVVGFGGADKGQVQHMVKTLLNLSAAPQSDAADALAIALCHYNMQQNLQKYGANKIAKGRIQ